MENSPARPLYLEDLSVGQKYFSPERYEMTAERIIAFAREFDPQWFHTDEEAAKDSLFHGLAASGWHTAAAAMKLLVSGGMPLAKGTIGVGGELNWPRPTRPGDILRLESEVLEIIPSRSKPNQAMVKVRNTMLNQRDEVVQVFTASILAHRSGS